MKVWPLNRAARLDFEGIFSQVSEPTLQRIAAGEADAIDDCLARYGDLVWSIARRLSKTSADAEDATQEIFLEIWKNAAKYNPDLSSEATFITMIARRRLIDRHRKQQRRPDTVTMDENMDQPMEIGPDAVELKEEVIRARKCMEQLRPDEKNVLELSIFHQLSQSKISEMLKIPLGTVKTHARRGLNRLRDMLKPDAVSGGAQ